MLGWIWKLEEGSTCRVYCFRPQPVSITKSARMLHGRSADSVLLGASQSGRLHRQPVPREDSRANARLHRGRCRCGDLLATGRHHLLLQQACIVLLPSYTSRAAPSVMSPQELVREHVNVVISVHAHSSQRLTWMGHLVDRPAADSLFARPVSIWNAVAAAIPI